MEICGIGGFTLMVLGCALCVAAPFANKTRDAEVAAETGILALCLGAEFDLLYLVHVGYLEPGAFTYALFACFTSVIFLTFVRGIIPHKL